MLKTLQRSIAFRTQGGATRSFARSAGLVGIIAGLIALLGWSVLPGYVIRYLGLSQIHPNTALGFLLVGFSLRLARFDPVNPWVHYVCRFFRLSVGVLGLLSLAEIWLGWNLGINQLIAHDPALGMTGPMPPAAALSFYLLGCALALLSAQRSLLCQVLTLAVTTIAVASLVAGCYALLAPQPVPASLIMPVITALVLLILSLGVLHMNANRALMAVVTSDTEGGTMARRLLPASIVIPIVLGFLRLKGQEAGWFGPALGLVLHVVATMVLLALFVWWNASALDRVTRENHRFGYAVRDTRTTMLEILQHVTNAVYAHDLEGNITFFNTAAERLFGVLADAVMRTNIHAFIAAESAAAARMVLSNRLIGGTRVPQGLVLRTATGNQECDVITTLVCDRNGNPVELFSVVAPLFVGTTPGRVALERLVHYVGADCESGLTTDPAGGPTGEHSLLPGTTEKRG